MKSITTIIACTAFLGFLAAADAAFAATGAPNTPKNTFSSRVGDMRVDMLSEAQRDGGKNILIGLSPEDAAKYIPAGTFPNAVCVFLVRTPERVVLIDAGYGTKLFDNMASLGVKADDVDAVLITHSHGDHIGGLLKDGVPAFPKAKVYISKTEFDWSTSVEFDWSASVREKLAPYGDRVATFAAGAMESGAELLPGIRPIASPGHTPGHALFMLESKGERMLIWGDVAHAMAIQMPRPGISVTYDSDPVTAAASRKAALQYVSGEKIPIGGMHVAYPGIGRIAADPETPGGYTFTPEGE